jgi:hypothetical protein
MCCGDLHCVPLQSRTATMITQIASTLSPIAGISGYVPLGAGVSEPGFSCVLAGASLAAEAEPPQDNPYWPFGPSDVGSPEVPTYTVTFEGANGKPQPFEAPPCVIVTPIALGGGIFLYQPNISNVKTGSFQVTFINNANEVVPLNFFFAAFAITVAIPIYAEEPPRPRA